jgi:hypothetical protein
VYSQYPKGRGQTQSFERESKESKTEKTKEGVKT